MTVAHANARVANLTIVEAEPDADAAGLDALALWAALRFSPVAAPDSNDGLAIDASGCAHLFGGEDAMLAEIVRRLQAANIAAHAAIADTLGAAHAVARFGNAAPMSVVPPGEAARTLAPLPVLALRVAPEIAAELRRFGFKRIEQLLAAPRAPLLLRFGEDLIRRLDQALGHAAEPVAGVIPEDAPRSRLRFLEPIVTTEALALVTQRLATELCGILAAKCLGARRLDLIFERVDQTTLALRAGMARASRDPRHLAKLLMGRLETVDLGFGVEAMTLVASLAEPLDARQLSTPGADAERDGADLAALLDRLSALPQATGVHAARPVESHVPERTVRFGDALAGHGTGSWPAAWPRPYWLFAPEPIETVALLPDAPPARFTWRGRAYRVRRADGPERIHLEWWRAPSEIRSLRDYYRVEDETGGRFWLFREGRTNEARWFLQGVFG